MARNNTAAIALALGAGGGALLWYLLRDRRHDDATTTTPPPSTPAPTIESPSPATTMSGPIAPESSPPTPPARTPGACKLRLDTGGLTGDGKALSIAGAVDLCKPIGKADLVYAHDAPAASLTDVYRALTTAGVSVVVWAP